ncbi:probable ADP-ribosylation factor GTPase-activating protein AGD14 isoform X2 [Diospyros lotus]|uniref:probable ADP-ribosylation factor GTPase-activating protein AGD14 isoform X2 n=1 Tax=Diospyros lotus TaxID=55363 RepID=UPI00225A3076|nr:probable ADP-ribosylation factor GTPase-activating protein AGD14 isoform X2 [Diospyros lotus]
MSSRKEEERNEKIIRGLLKLPPNRRCINCNSLGPQYVCTNFWTFVCTTCSGIHREFTHRVKSVSMAKFTSQEVEALQKGGNQRAREMFLNDWDPQRQRLPDSSNADKVREFIKNVYVERRYAGGKNSDKPPRDDNLRHHEETRRASSYHSYSQSPPYDYQYEERRYGKQAPVLTRKPGSDRCLYEGRISGFFSPSRFTDQMNDDRFSNEGSNPRASDYSVSSAGDPFRSATQSPDFEREIEFSSPTYKTSRDISNQHIRHQTMRTFSLSNAKTDAEKLPRPQRTASAGSFGSFDSNSMSFKSANSVSLVDALGPEPSAETNEDRQHVVSFVPQLSESGSFGGLDLFNAPYAPKDVRSAASDTDLFHLPDTSPAPVVDLFQPSSISSVPALHQSFQAVTSSLDLFSEMPQQQLATILDPKPVDVTPNNDGWATFDLPQHVAPMSGIDDSSPAIISSSNGSSLGKFDPLLCPTTSGQWPASGDIDAHGCLSMPSPWHDGLDNPQVIHNTSSAHSWNAFEDDTLNVPLGNIQQSSKEVTGAPSTTVNRHESPDNAQFIHNTASAHSWNAFEDDTLNVATGNIQQSGKEVTGAPPTTVNQYFTVRLSKDFNDGVLRDAVDTGPPAPVIPLYLNGSSYDPSAIPSAVGAQLKASNSKSTNPFDLPYDSDIGSSSMFLDMSSLQAALPTGHIPDSFLHDVSQPWYAQNPVAPYVPAAQQGGLEFMGGQVASTQIPNVPTQGSVASVGGNPFA